MNSAFIIAYTFSVNILENRMSFLIRKKELQGFVLKRGVMRKQNLCLVQEGELCKFPTGILLEKDSYSDISRDFLGIPFSAGEFRAGAQKDIIVNFE